MRLTGYNEFSLLSLSCSDYLSLPAVGIEIKNRLQGENVSLSLPSQRVDRFDDDIAHIISNSGKRSGLTFAPEAGTQRLRDIINKGLTNEELLRGVKTAWDKGWRQVKLYFMVGLPGETDADVLGIADTIAWLQRECRSGKWHLAVNVTISNFTPKPHTPFQWHTVSTAEFERKQALLREALRPLHQVKANFTPVRISAMEDFIGRGDRRLGAVVRRAWELGATNDAWWASQDAAFAAWDQAIAESGLGWKYRQVLDGEWDVMESLGDVRYRGQGGGGKGRLDRGQLADERLDAPLPWDHIDTGIAKWWLKADLQRALEAATVPDCSHSGICTECGVCGEEFGENVVFEPPPVPEFKGHRKQDSRQAQRLRFRFAKGGDMVFVGHLDLMQTFDRAARRAALPVSADESPFAARQRIYAALPLPLGATSSCEWLELTLTQRDEPEAVRAKLQAQLPAGLHLRSVEEVEIKKTDGSNGEKMAQLLEAVEYYLVLEEEGAAAAAVDSTAQVSASGADSRAASTRRLGAAVAAALALPAYVVRRQAKKGKKKVMESDLRPALLELEACTRVPQVLADVNAPLGPRSAVLHFRTACQFGNPILSPAALLAMLNSMAAPSSPSSSEAARSSNGASGGGRSNGVSSSGGSEASSSAAGGDGAGGSEQGGASVGAWALAHVHRSDICLRPPARPQPDLQRVRSLLRQEGHLAAAKAFAGTGPWAGGIENRTDPQ